VVLVSIWGWIDGVECDYHYTYGQVYLLYLVGCRIDLGLALCPSVVLIHDFWKPFVHDKIWLTMLAMWFDHRFDVKSEYKYLY